MTLDPYTILVGVVALMTAITNLVTAVVVLLAASVFRGAYNPAKRE